ncbi:MAG: RNA polymerase factor sigma-54 [Sphingomonadaceae bacterium]
MAAVLGPRLQLQTSQQLVLTPQLQQAIQLLTLTNVELEAFLEAELEKNPLLEIERGEQAGPDVGSGVAEGLGGPGAGGQDDDSPSDDDQADAAMGDPDDPAPTTADQLLERGDAQADPPLDAEVTETFPDAFDDAGQAGMSAPGAEPGGEAGDIEALGNGPLSLREHLEAQATEQLSGTNLAIACRLIDLIDDAGYLRASLEEEAAALGVPLWRVQAVLERIQGFDPTGVGARSLAECLGLQARERGWLDEPMRRLLRNLEALARGDLATIRRATGLRGDDLAALLARLRALDPRPGRAFGGETSLAVVPDVFVRRTATGWSIELNTATLPRVLVNRRYHAELARGAQGPARQFLDDCLASARWLTRALDQRARTITTVATELVRQQEGFFLSGIRGLRPLTLRHIADAVGLHESTVSRATANKYLACDRGTFEMKFFFTPALASTEGERDVSNETVRRRVRELIEAETADSVLSDDQIVQHLRAEGYEVARRTIAKYRDQMKLGSSVERRRRLLLGR